ncbi:hypothetical protein SAMN04488527_13811 [Aliiroseovarius crassostreae]|nr:hypothetical protein SAMN04488527_13811 [Aliiroseovarius crassostreae]
MGKRNNPRQNRNATRLMLNIHELNTFTVGRHDLPNTVSAVCQLGMDLPTRMMGNDRERASGV